jgi:hypothetical protein
MEDKYLNDISEIKNMMSKSSQFISLSGLSGIMAGIYALIGAYLARQILTITRGMYSDRNYVVISENISNEQVELRLYSIAFSVLVASIITAGVLTFFKAKKQNEQIWNASAKRMIVNFIIPLVTGGVFGLILLRNGYYGLIAPITLLFYGLACVSASKYTFRDVRYLGITIIIIGLICTEFTRYSLEFWALGFGVCHILYGSIMHFKYDRK